MSQIRVDGFRGLIPRQSTKLMDEHYAQEIIDARISSGAIEGWRNDSLDEAIPLLGDVQTIYRDEQGNWLQFNDDVDIVKAPIANDTTDRLYYTGDTRDSPLKLRVTNNTLIDSPAATSGTVDGATQANPVVINDTGHGLFTGALITPTGETGMVEINDIEFRVTVVDANNFSLDGINGSGYTAANGDGTWARSLNQFPEDSKLAGVPAPTTAPTVALAGAAGSNPEAAAYVYTFVNDWGEESAPSPPSSVITVTDTESVDITDMDQAITGNYVGVGKWRLYRIASGNTGADYLFLAEVTINASTPQYNDVILTANLGEVLPTEGWDLPPDGLKGLTSMSNGVVAGFIDNTVYFCEPFLPYTYPHLTSGKKYTLSTDYPIVGLGYFGISLVVCTEAETYLITGYHPDSMSMEKLPYKHACVSKRGIVAVEGGVIFPAPDGLFYIGAGGGKLITEDYYTRKEWQILTPQLMIGEFHDNRYIFQSVSQRGFFMYQPKERELIVVAGDYTAFYVDPQTDTFYNLVNDLGTNKIYTFNTAGTRRSFRWKSKVFYLNGDQTMTAARIIGDFEVALTAEELALLEEEIAAAIAFNANLIATEALGGELNGNSLNQYAVNDDALIDVPQSPQAPEYTFRLYQDGGQIYEITINNDNPFRLPRGYRSKSFEIEVIGLYPLHGVVVGNSIQDVIG